MVSRKVKFAVRDYMALPESEEKRYELIDGELHVVPSSTPRHQRAAIRLSTAMEEFVRRRELGEVFAAPLDVVLSDQDVLQPALMFISGDRAAIVAEQNVQGPPDLVVEILSPATAERDRTVKRVIYARYGVREYWTADPEARTIEVLKASEAGFETVRVYPEGMSVVSPLLEDMRIDVARVFR